MDELQSNKQGMCQTDRVKEDSSFSCSPAGKEGMTSTEFRSWRGACLRAENHDHDYAFWFKESWDYSRGSQVGSSEREPGL